MSAPARPPPGELLDARLKEAAQERSRPEPLSLAERLALLPEEERAAVLALPAADCAKLLHDWRFWGRPSQFAPEDPHWVVWLLLCGRGWGKTRTGAEWVRERVESGEARSIGLIGPSLGDVWKTMVFGTLDAPGLVAVFGPRRRVEVRRSDRQVVMHEEGCDVEGTECGCPVATVYTAEEPELRGPNLDTVWCDELAKWRYLRTIWDNLEMALRAVGRKPPRICITTTPRPLDLLKELLDDPDVRVTWGATFANAANLASTFVSRMVRKYSKSRLGQQELFGALLGDNPDALFRATSIDAAREEACPDLVRVVVAVDPAVSTKKRSDLTGIAVLGIGADGDIYVLADLSGCAFDREAKGLKAWREEEPRKHSPEEWAELVLRAYWHFKADAVVAEVNRGGDLVAANVRAAVYRMRGPNAVVPVETVRATRGKMVRAEPVSTLYEQGRVHHVGQLPDLEAEMTEWNPGLSRESPNRLDAVVWGVFALAHLGDDPEEDPTPGYRGLAAANRRLRAGDGCERALSPRATRDRRRESLVRDKSEDLSLAA